VLAHKEIGAFGNSGMKGLRDLGILDCRLKHGNYKSQNPNNKWFDKLTTLSLVEGQITMTEIVRASLGLPTLQAGPQFQNSKPPYHLKKRESQICLGH